MHKLFSGISDPESQNSEFQRLRLQLGEQETKWRKAYENIVKENELLRTRGGEAILALQWRERYEVKEKIFKVYSDA